MKTRCPRCKRMVKESHYACGRGALKGVRYAERALKAARNGSGICHDHKGGGKRK